MITGLFPGAANFSFTDGMVGADVCIVSSLLGSVNEVSGFRTAGTTFMTPVDCFGGWLEKTFGGMISAVA